MNTLSVYLKKIFQNKIRLLLTVANFALGMLLSLIIFTIGINLSINIRALVRSKQYYGTLYAYTTNKTEQIDLKTTGDVSRISAIRSDNIYLTSIKGQEDLLVSVTEYDKRFDLIVPGGKIVAGSDTISDGEMLLGKAFLDEFGVSYEEIINSSITLSNGEAYTVVGVFDDKIDIYSTSNVLIFADSKFDSSQFILETLNVDNVSKIKSNLVQHNYGVYCYESEIKESKSYSRLINAIFFAIALVVLVATSLILYSSVKSSINDKLVFISMLKVLGYDDKKISLFILFEIFIIFLLSSILSTGLYYLLLSILHRYVNIEILFSEVLVVNVFTNNIFALLITLFLGIIATFFVFLKNVITVKKCEVCKILMSVKQ